jgi:starch phosphorylase
MVSQYSETFYFPMAKRYKKLQEKDLSFSKELVTWKQHVNAGWHDVRVEKVETDEPTAIPEGEGIDAASPLCVGDCMHVTAYVRLGDIAPQDVAVEVMSGVLDSNRQITGPIAQSLVWKSEENGLHRYEGDLTCLRSGLQGFSVRVRPAHADAVLPQELSLITWE